MPDHQHPSPAGDELPELLEAYAESWSGHRQMAGYMCVAAARIRDADTALASERSARQAAEEERDEKGRELDAISDENAENVRLLDWLAERLAVPHDQELSREILAGWIDRAQAAEAERERLREALKPFAEAATAMEISGQPAAYHVGADACLAARSALASQQEGEG